MLMGNIYYYYNVKVGTRLLQAVDDLRASTLSNTSLCNFQCVCTEMMTISLCWSVNTGASMGRSP